jgi:hypothetical protein
MTSPEQRLATQMWDSDLCSMVLCMQRYLQLATPNLVAAQTYWKSVEDYFLDAAAYDYLDYKELMNQAHQIVTNSDNIVEEPAELQGY